MSLRHRVIQKPHPGPGRAFRGAQLGVGFPLITAYGEPLWRLMRAGTVDLDREVCDLILPMFRTHPS